MIKPMIGAALTFLGVHLAAFYVFWMAGFDFGVERSPDHASAALAILMIAIVLSAVVHGRLSKRDDQ